MDILEKPLYDARARVLKALAHPTRLWIVDRLAAGERCVCTFVDAIDADFSTISKHLALLKQAGIVTDEKRGKQVYYRLTTPCITNFLQCIEAEFASQTETNQSPAPKSPAGKLKKE